MKLFTAAHYVLFIVIAWCLFASCQKGTTSLPPVTPPPGALPDSIKVGFICNLPTELKETSGLCSTDGAMWSFGDSGNPNAIYKIDTATGTISQTVTIANYNNVDWEDITADANYIYIGDFGNNVGVRKDLKILRVKKSDLVSGASQLSVQAEAINYSYADQTNFTANNNTNFNCEALVAVGDSLYLFSKDGGDLLTRCYSLSKEPGTYVVAPNASFEVQGRITAAAYNSTTKELALLGYLSLANNSFIWFFNEYTNNQFFNGVSKKFVIGRPTQDWQTEGLEYVGNNRLMMSCEQSFSHAASLYYVQRF